MLTPSQIEALSSAQSEISAIIKDLTERMKAKGYEDAYVHIAFMDYGCEIYLLAPGAKAFLPSYDPKPRDYAFRCATALPIAAEEACIAVAVLPDRTEQSILAGEAS